MALQAADVAKLKKAGWTAAEINKLSTEPNNTALQTKAQKALGGANPWSGYDFSPLSLGIPEKVIFQNKPQQPAIPLRDKIGAGVSFGGVPATRTPGPVAAPIKVPTAQDLGRVGTGRATTVPDSQQNQTVDYTKLIGGDKGGGKQYNSFGGPFGTPLGDYKHPFPDGYVPFTPDGKGDSAAGGIPGLVEGDPYPDLAPIEQPVISMKDYTDQAVAATDKAFAPLIAGLNDSKAFIGQQGDRNRKVLSGLYSNMVSDIASAAAESDQQYQGQKADVGQRGQQLQQQIGQNYSSGNQQVADLSQQLGLQQQAPQNLQQGANDQAWLQGLAGQNTNAVQDYFGKEQQGEANLNANRQDVARTSGAVAQENSLNQEAIAQQGVDQQIAAANTDKARTALDMGQNLSQQDMQMQEANAGYSLQTQGMNQDQLLNKWKASRGDTDALNQYNQWKYGAQTQADDTAWNRQMDQSKLDLDVATAAAKTGSQAGATLDLADYTGIGKAKASLYNQYGDAGTDLANLVTNVASMSDGIPKGDINLFMQDVFAHKDPRFTDDQLRNAAYTMWSELKQSPQG